MRVLVTIPHFFNPGGTGNYGSVGQDPQPRLWALTQCLRALRALFDSSQEYWVREGDRLRPRIANADTALELDVVVCTTGDYHLLDQVPFPAGLFQHRPSKCEPLYLGYECHAALRDHLGQYDFYCYMEDDLVLHDPYFFAKLAWFNARIDEGGVLQPNRFEFSYTQRLVKKVYIDFEIDDNADRKADTVDLPILNQTIQFRRTSNAHAGAFFLSHNQLTHWVDQPYFLDRDDRYVGPLESAATLGLIRTFRVYKPAPHNANFLEIQHYGQAWSHKLHRVRIPG